MTETIYGHLIFFLEEVATEFDIQGLELDGLVLRGMGDLFLS
jgi:hypothetical protein